MYLNFWLEQLTLFTIEAYYAQHSTYYVPPPPVFQTLRRPWLHIIQNRKTSFRKMCWFQPLTFLNFSKQIMKKGYEYWKRKRNRSRLKTNSMHEVILNCTVCSTACTVRPRDTRPQAARTLTVHVFELGPKKFEKHVFWQKNLRSTFFDKFLLEKHVFW